VLEPYALLAERALRDEPPSREQARRILDGEGYELLPLLYAAYLPRERHFGRKVMVHVLNNVQSGHCSEDCGYCSQSRDSQAAVREYPMKSDEEIFAEAEKAALAGASRYCMALAGRGPSLARTRKLAGLIRDLKQRYPIEVCLSVGILDEERARILSEAGLDRLNHNLNTSESHYRAICSTHDYADRLATLAAAKRHGLEPCSGLILGMGESSTDAVEVAFALRELEVPSIPVNFLIPIAGNPVVSDGSLTPQRCLRALAMIRLVNPGAEVRVAGGREGHLRALQALALWPANSLFVEGYLTTRGDAVRDTYRMIREAGFELEGNELSCGEAIGESGAEEAAGGGFRLAGGDGGLLKPELAREE
jgi:biotin synthase